MDLSRHPIHFLDFLRKRKDAGALQAEFVNYAYVRKAAPAASLDEALDDLFSNPVVAADPYPKKCPGEDRKYQWVPLADVTEEWLREKLAAAGDTTFGFTGRIKKVNEEAILNEDFFVPMFDLVVRSKRNYLAEMLKHLDFAKDDATVEGALYETDNSFHAYFSKLVPMGEFATVMGDALLFNDSDDAGLSEQIDTRWVGNSLMRGFGTMRWSKKHTDPKGLPKLVERRYA
jgi:hypothetical protein